LLDKLEFSNGEKILDVGCNAGLFSSYLQNRGCNVTGIDIDPCVIKGAKILANIHNESTRFYHVDLDEQDILGYFDTVMLFSVIHHTSNIFENCKKVSENASRIIIECRLKESGAKPTYNTNSDWVPANSWSFNDLASMKQGLMNLFKGFTCKTVFGPCDRKRYIIELVR